MRSSIFSPRWLGNMPSSSAKTACAAFELLPLFLRDDPVLDHLGIELLVHRLELAEADVARDLADLEPLAVLERRVVHEIQCRAARAPHKARKFPSRPDTLGGSMHESIDDLYARWQRNPDVTQTVALCDALRGSQRMDLVEIVGSHAARQLDVHTLTAAARMYTHTGRLDDAQQVLIAAGAKTVPMRRSPW